MRTRTAGIAASATALALLALPAAAGEFYPHGDGSGTNNPGLTLDATTACEDCLSEPPYEWGDAPFDLDWSLGLRGGIRQDGSGGERTYEIVALPEFTLRHETLRGGYEIGMEGDVSYDAGGTLRINALTARAEGDYRLDQLTTLEGRASLAASQDDPADLDAVPSVVSEPLVVTGTGEASLLRNLGALDLTLRGKVGRVVNGETVYDDDTTLDNSFENTTLYGGGARLGYKLTPGLTAFIDAEAERELYDQPSPSLRVKLDNVTYAGRGGLNLKYGETLELEGSLGLGYRDFGDDTLADFSAVLYDARAVFRPDETLALSGTFSTTISSPGNASVATARLAYEAVGEVSYQLNPWLRLRGDAAWSEAHYQGIDTDEHSWEIGTGADYLLNEHTDLTADYSFLRTEKTPAPATDEHQVTLGVRLHR
ncbi:MAG: hypothetical protein JWQ89_538 [Devosia sp.]|uniref:outer membrane beta-barrel protein n=1 Tax=Devosia sp. TaxID=1871048 RepID=UPI0026318CC4|nr:outer membrane beta-barrel protein [Devosia sp.]MDB5538811.1 hypothetical protein [Devosia sp.]